MNGWLEWTVTLVGGLLAAAAASASQSLEEVSWHELRELALRRRRRDRFDDIYDHSERVLIAADILKLAGVVMVLAGMLVLPARADHVTPWHWGGGVVLLLVLTVWLPHAAAQLLAPRYLFHTWPVWRMLTKALEPLAWGVEATKALLRRMAGKDDEETEEEALEDEIRAIVAEGQYEGLLEADTREMIEGVIELDDTNVGDVMTPKSAMETLPADVSWDDLLAFVIKVGRTRIPVYDGHPENIIGILYVKDLLPELAKQRKEDRRPIREILRKPIQVPKSTRLDELLQRFLRERKHLFLVVDEYMNLAGLVTIEDVLEEIVGEIVDESDEEEEAEIQRIDDDSAIVLGRTHVDTVNEQLGLEIPHDQDFDTLGGFILRQLGRVPAPGEQWVWNDLQITVLRASSRRVEQVRLTLLAGAKS